MVLLVSELNSDRILAHIPISFNQECKLFFKL